MDLSNLKVMNNKILVKKYNKAQSSNSGPLITGIQNPNMGTLVYFDSKLAKELKENNLEKNMIIFYGTKREQVFVGQEQFELMDLANVFAVLGYPEKGE